MSAEAKTFPNWNLVEGTVLEGGYEVGQCLGAGSTSATFKIRILGDRFTEAQAIIFAPGAVGTAQLLLWREVAALRHPNLDIPLGTGEIQVNGARFPYLVSIKPDETLAGVLKERSLNAKETREALWSLIDGLQFLHDNGLVHSAVCPENIVAVGPAIKLSTTQLRRINTPLASADTSAPYTAPESKDGNLTPAADIFCLGASLFEMLTQRRWTEADRESTRGLFPPLNHIIECCLLPDSQERCKLADLRAALRGQPLKNRLPSQISPSRPVSAPEIAALAAAATAQGQPHPKPASPTNGAPKVVVTAVTPLDAVVVPLNGNAAPTEKPAIVNLAPGSEPKVVKAEPILEPAPKSSEPVAIPPVKREVRTSAVPDSALVEGTAMVDETELFRSSYAPSRPARKETEAPSRTWMYVVAGVVVIAGLLWLVRPKHPSQQAVPQQSALANTPAPTSPKPAWPSQVVGPSSTKTAGAAAPASAPLGTTVGPTPDVAGHVWRVVAYTYRRQDDAAKRVKTIRSKHSALKPEIYEPNGKTGPYLVVLGNWMTKVDAERARRQARASGMPRDTYIQNYNR